MDSDISAIFLTNLINSSLTKGFTKINLEFIIKNQIKREINTLYIKDSPISIDNKRLYIVGAGKGTYILSKFLIPILGSNYISGIINVPKNQSAKENELKNTTVIHAGHPIPDKETFRGTEKQLTLLNSLNENDIVFVIITGGASSLLEYPVQNISEEDIINTYKLLLTSGLSIQEINSVRKHLSQIKGGKFALKTKAQIITLLISDIPGDELSAIGSGPTITDQSTFSDCLHFLQKRKILHLLPSSVKNFLTKNQNKNNQETIKKFQKPVNVENFLLCSNKSILNDIYEHFSNYIPTDICSTSFAGEASEIGKFLSTYCNFPYVSIPRCLLFGGESVVTLPPSNNMLENVAGGRNQELIVSFIQTFLKESIKNNILVVSIGTDGIDGYSPNAGAIWTNCVDDFDSLESLKIDLALQQHNTANILPEQYYIRTGPTGTNVGDIIILLLF